MVILSKVIFAVLALVLVLLAAKYFLKTVEKLGRGLGLPPFLMGVILVGFGTSLPELATSLAAVFKGNQEITLANVIGSNLANTLVVASLLSLFLGRVSWQKKAGQLNYFTWLAVSLVFVIFLADHRLQSYQGALLLVGFLAYIYYLIRRLKKDPKVERAPLALAESSRLVFLALIWLATLILASKIVIDNLLALADLIDLASEKLSFVFIALGTSLPEIAVSWRAFKAGQNDLVLGNLIGSSIFNILLIAGLASLLAEQFLTNQLAIFGLLGLLLSLIWFSWAIWHSRLSRSAAVIGLGLYLLILFQII